MIQGTLLNSMMIIYNMDNDCHLCDNDWEYCSGAIGKDN